MAEANGNQYIGGTATGYARVHNGDSRIHNGDNIVFNIPVELDATPRTDLVHSAIALELSRINRSASLALRGLSTNPFLLRPIEIRDELLLEAVAHHEIPRIKHLLAAGVDTEHRSQTRSDLPGDVALHLATKNGHVDSMRLLLNGLASPNIRDGQGRTPIFMAAAVGSRDGVQLLLDTGADPSKVELVNGFSSLHMASIQNHADIVELLLKKGRSRCNANARSTYHQATALTYAIAFGSLDATCALLLSEPRDLDSIRNALFCSKKLWKRFAVTSPTLPVPGFGNYGFFVAIRNGHSEVICFLLDYLPVAVFVRDVLHDNDILTALLIETTTSIRRLLFDFAKKHNCLDWSRAEIEYRRAISKGQWELAELLREYGRFELKTASKRSRNPFKRKWSDRSPVVESASTPVCELETVQTPSEIEALVAALEVEAIAAIAEVETVEARVEVEAVQAIAEVETVEAVTEVKIVEARVEVEAIETPCELPAYGLIHVYELPAHEATLTFRADSTIYESPTHGICYELEAMVGPFELPANEIVCDLSAGQMIYELEAVEKPCTSMPTVAETVITTNGESVEPDTISVKPTPRKEAKKIWHNRMLAKEQVIDLQFLGDEFLFNSNSTECMSGDFKIGRLFGHLFRPLVLDANPFVVLCQVLGSALLGYLFLSQHMTSHRLEGGV